MSKGKIQNFLSNALKNVYEKFTESATYRFICAKGSFNKKIGESALATLPETLKEQRDKKYQKRKRGTAPKGRKPLKREGERVGVVDASDIPKGIRYRISGAVAGSKAVSILDRVWKYVCGVQASLAGALMILVSIMSFAVSLIKHIMKTATDSDTFGLVFSFVMFIVAVLLVSANTKTLYEVFAESAFGSEFLMNVMGKRLLDSDFDRQGTGIAKESTPPHTLWIILFCMVICVLSVSVGIVNIMLSFLILFLLAAIFKMPESGVIMLLAAFPITSLFEHGDLYLAIASAVVFVSWLIKLAVGQRVFRIQAPDVAVGAFLVMYLAAGILSLGAADDPLEPWGYFVTGLLYFPTVGMIRSEQWLTRAIRAFTMGAMAVSLFGIVQFVAAFASNGSIALGITSVFHDSHTLAAYLLVGIFICLFSIYTKKNEHRSFSSRLTLLLCLVCFVLAGSKTACLALAIALTFYLLMERRGVLGALLIAIPVAITVVSMLPDGVGDFVRNLITTTDTDMRSKFHVWNCVLDSLGKYVWTGIGTTQSALEAAWQGYGAIVPSADQFFNLYITVLIKVGLMGALALVTMLIFSLQKGFAVMAEAAKGTYFRKASAVSLSATVALMAFGMGDSLIYSRQMLLLILLCVGLNRVVFSVYAVQNMAKEEDPGLDIDLDTQRYVNSSKKPLVSFVRFIMKLVKKIVKAFNDKGKNKPKKKTEEKIKKRSEKQVDVQIDESEAVISDENTYEEESTCQEK